MITVKHTNELTSKELIDILKERVKVFVVEQNCPYQEVDDDDYDDDGNTTEITGKKSRKSRKSDDDYDIDFVDI